jgi:uncharacterized protein YkwD
VRRSGRALTLAPFALVGILAIAITLAGIVVTPRGPIADATAMPSETVRPTATTAQATASASPTATAARADPNDPAEMLQRHNTFRDLVGAPRVRGDARAIAAAQHHAEYLAQSGIVGHDEVAGQPGFTGATVRERLAAQGYDTAAASEVAASGGSGVEAVGYLWDLPYHRLGLMHPQAIVTGWGHAEIGGHSATVGVIVFDFASAAPDKVRSPASDQRVAASWHGEASPDVLPNGASRPVGYPIMVVYGSARSVDIRGGRLSDASGEALPFYLVPQIYERDYVAIVPTSPLRSGSRYRVRLDLTVAGDEVVEEWEFATEP